MGAFFSMSGVASADRSAIEDALRAYAKRHDGDLQPLKHPQEFSDVVVMKTSADGRTTIAWPGEFFDWDEASQFLSQHLDCSVFSFHIHDGDLWMYVLYARGREADCFNPVPDYWNGDLSDPEIERWSGDAARIAANWPGVGADAIRKYLVRWNLADSHPSRACPDDEHTYNDCWQVLDFLKKLGLDGPFNEQGEPIGDLYRFEVWGDTDI